MNIINSTVLRNNFADAFKEINNKQDYLLVAKKGKIVSALVNIDFFEDLLALANKDYKKSIKIAREEYKKGKILSHEDAFGDV